MDFSFKPEQLIRETDKAVCFEIKHNDAIKKMWISKSTIEKENPKSWKTVGVITIPDWLWDKKEELF